MGCVLQHTPCIFGPVNPASLELSGVSEAALKFLNFIVPHCHGMVSASFALLGTRHPPKWRRFWMYTKFLLELEKILITTLFPRVLILANVYVFYRCQSGHRGIANHQLSSNNVPSSHVKFPSTSSFALLWKTLDSANVSGCLRDLGVYSRLQQCLFFLLLEASEMSTKTTEKNC